MGITNHSVFNVEFCLFGTTYVAASSAGHLYCAVTATTCPCCPAPFCLHRACKYVQQAWATLAEGEGMTSETLDKRAAALCRLHIATLLTHPTMFYIHII